MWRPCVHMPGPGRVRCAVPCLGREGTVGRWPDWKRPRPNSGPLLHLDMRLGEGTGGSGLWPLTRCADIYNDMATFEVLPVWRSRHAEHDRRCQGDLDTPRVDDMTANPVACPAKALAATSAADPAADPVAVPLLELREVSRRFAVRRGFFAEQRLLTAVDAVSLCLYPVKVWDLWANRAAANRPWGGLPAVRLRPQKGRLCLAAGSCPWPGPTAGLPGRFR